MDDLPHVSLTDHAWMRSAQRNLDPAEVAFIVKYGRRIHKAGVIFCQLRRRDVPHYLEAGHRFHRLPGSTVVLAKDGESVLTMYRSEKAFRKDNKKRKYNRKAKREAMPWAS